MSERPAPLGVSPLVRVSPAGLWVMAGWLCLAGLPLALLMPPFPALLLLSLLLLGGRGVLELLFGRLTVQLAGGRLCFSRGFVFRVEVSCPAAAITELCLLRTPMLCLARCRVALVRIPGRWFLLPALNESGLQALCKALDRPLT